MTVIPSQLSTRSEEFLANSSLMRGLVSELREKTALTAVGGSESARKSVEPNQEKRILIYVESAYPELASVPSPHSTREMSFAEALGKVWAPGAGSPKKKASK